MGCNSRSSSDRNDECKGVFKVWAKRPRIPDLGFVRVVTGCATISRRIARGIKSPIPPRTITPNQNNPARGLRGNVCILSSCIVVFRIRVDADVRVRSVRIRVGERLGGMDFLLSSSSSISSPCSCPSSFSASSPSPTSFPASPPASASRTGNPLHAKGTPLPTPATA